MQPTNNVYFLYGVGGDMQIVTRHTLMKILVFFWFALALAAEYPVDGANSKINASTETMRIGFGRVCVCN